MDPNEKKEYDWIDDPFKDDQKQPQQKMSYGAKTAVGCGCLTALIVVVILFVLTFSALQNFLSTF